MASVFNQINIMSRGDCESTTPPMVLSETVPYVEWGTWARSGDRSYAGSYSYKLTKTQPWNYIATALLTNTAPYTLNLHGLLPGETYQLKTRIYVPSGVGADNLNGISIFFGQTDNGVSWNTYLEYPNAYDQWQQRTVYITTYSNVIGLFFGVNLGINNLQDSYIYFDDFELLNQTGAGLSREAIIVVSPTVPLEAFILGDVLSQPQVGPLLTFLDFEKVRLESNIDVKSEFNSKITEESRLYSYCQMVSKLNSKITTTEKFESRLE